MKNYRSWPFCQNYILIPYTLLLYVCSQKIYPGRYLRVDSFCRHYKTFPTEGYILTGLQNVYSQDRPPWPLLRCRGPCRSQYFRIGNSLGCPTLLKDNHKCLPLQYLLIRAELYRYILEHWAYRVSLFL